MRRITTLIFLLLLSIFGFAQSSEIDSLSIQLAFQKADTTKIDTSLKLIQRLYNTGEYDRALKYIIESEKLSTSLNYDKGTAEITYFKSLIYSQKNGYINAMNGYTRSKDLFNQIQDTLGIAKVNNSIGLIEIKRGNYTKGIQYSLSAIEELEKRHWTRFIHL